MNTFNLALIATILIMVVWLFGAMLTYDYEIYTIKTTSYIVFAFFIPILFSAAIVLCFYMLLGYIFIKPIRLMFNQSDDT